jgi:hypothetical protein
MGMAFRVKLVFDTDAGERWEESVPWWDAYEILNKAQFEDVSTVAGYSDFESTMSRDEVVRWQQCFASHVPSNLTAQVLEVDRKLTQMHAGSAIRVRVIEWESGFG